jgi:predicted double-glycine peptidase
MLARIWHSLTRKFGGKSPSSGPQRSKIKALRFPLLMTLVLFLSLLLAIPLKLHAAQLQIFLPGGGIYMKKVESFKDRRLHKVVPQTVDYSCGAAAMATLLRYHFGHQVAEKEVTLGMFQTGDKDEIRQRGFSMLDMKNYARSRGLQVEGYKIEDVNALKKMNIPVIALIDTARYKHFVVVRKVDDRFVYVSDPSWGNRKISLEDFKNNWNRVILVCTGACEGTPEGLFSEAEDCASPKDRAVHDRSMLGHRFAMDPTNAIYRVGMFSRTPITGLINGALGTVR